MSDDRSFYVTELTIRVLAEDNPWDGDLQWLSHDITEGEYVGYQTAEETRAVTPEEMATLLEAAGSDPSFFQLDEEA